MTLLEGTIELIKAISPLADAIAWPVAILAIGLVVGPTVAHALAEAIRERNFTLKHGDTSFELLPPQSGLPAGGKPAIQAAVEVTREAMSGAAPPVTPTPTPTPTSAAAAAINEPDPPELANVPKVEIARIMVYWHCMYLSAFLQPHTIGVLVWLEANGNTSKSDLLAVWRPTIPEVQELERVLIALESNQLIEVNQGAVSVTMKGRNFLAWRVQNNFYPTKLDSFKLAPRPAQS